MEQTQNDIDAILAVLDGDYPYVMVEGRHVRDFYDMGLLLKETAKIVRMWLEGEE